MIMFSTEVISFYKTLHLNTPLPKDVEVMNPYQDEDAFSITKKFYKKSFDKKEAWANYIAFLEPAYRFSQAKIVLKNK